jgi:hypothetical protein
MVRARQASNSSVFMSCSCGYQFSRDGPQKMFDKRPGHERFELHEFAGQGGHGSLLFTAVR